MEKAMRPSKIALFATVGVIAAGVIGLASARINPVHVVTLALPDGSVERVAYVGDSPPRVAVEMESMPLAPAFVPVAGTALALDPAFADLERISVAMDREAAAMMLAAPAEDGLQAASARPGAGVCGRSVEYRYAGDGKAPTVLTRTWGACGRVPSPSAPTASLRSAPVPGAPLIQATYRHGGKTTMDSHSL
jgi:hypothetical protein